MYMNNGLSLLKVVNGLSRTLNIANQMIPLYKQVKPILANSNKILSGIKSLNTNRNTFSSPSSQSQKNYEPLKQTSQHPLNLPTFFQ